MSFCDDCRRGVTHEGEAKGKWEKLGNVDCYIATPEGEYAEDKVLLLLADGLGPRHINSQLLADSFAAEGFKTISPDYLNGDPFPIEALQPDFDFRTFISPWLSRHGEAQTRPALNNVIQSLKASGVTSFGATGYCFGGRYVFDLAFENITKVSVASHPTMIQSPVDFEKYTTLSKAPLLINSCTYDEQLPLEAQAKADEVFAGFTPGYKRQHFEGMTHGFAVRGDLNDPKVKPAIDGAFAAAVDWIRAGL